MITKQQLKELKGECLRIDKTGLPPSHHPKSCICKGTGKATIEIKKEWVECKCGCHIEFNLSKMRLIDCLHHSCKGKIPKYKVGDEIYIWHSTFEDIILTKQEYELMLSALDDWQVKETKEKTTILKILSETEDKWKVCLG